MIGFLVLGIAAALVVMLLVGVFNNADSGQQQRETVDPDATTQLEAPWTSARTAMS